MKLTKNFNLIEFACKSGHLVPIELHNNAKKLAENLQIIRDEIKEPLNINSAYRTKEHNQKEGGKKYSKHLICIAADLASKNHTPKELQKIILNLIKEKKISEGGVGLYKGFVHYDIRGTQARW